MDISNIFVIRCVDMSADEARAFMLLCKAFDLVLKAADVVHDALGLCLDGLGEREIVLPAPFPVAIVNPVQLQEALVPDVTHHGQEF